MSYRFMFRTLFVILSVFSVSLLPAQDKPNWKADGSGMYVAQQGGIAEISLPSMQTKEWLSARQLTPEGRTTPLSIRKFSVSDDGKKVLIYTNTKKVWRYDTRGDYWIYDFASGKLQQLGVSRPASSLMFAKISPDGKSAAYVSEYNLYVEDLATHQVKALTEGGNRELINGTFDWAYEEEFFCRDGFRWSPDSKKIAYWQIDAKNTKDYLMIDNTDSAYPFAKPVVYPIAGEPPSTFHIGVVDIASAHTQWMDISSDPVLKSYATRMEWAASNDEIVVQHMSRRQNESDILMCNVNTGKSVPVYHEKDSAWIDLISLWDFDYWNGGWDWINKGKEFIWASEKDGWRHLYRVSRDGKKETLITVGAFDVMNISGIDEKGGYIYYIASPDNATQAYLYRSRLDGKAKPERVTPANQPGTHEYQVSPGAHFAMHDFSNYYTPPASEWVTLPDHKPIQGFDLNQALARADKKKSTMEFFKIRSAEGVEMDAWMVKPVDFDPTKKYPIVFFVYTEPWGQNVKDEYRVGRNFLYRGDMTKDGYLYVSIDNRGTPVPKGRAWRKAIYRKLGQVNISDQAAAAKEVLKFPFVDTSRVAVWGWSGGGTATLNLMFQYPEIYKTGIAIAAESSLFTYDNIYQERYMGLPAETKEDYIKGSPMTHAKNLQGNLLYIHGTGDDNVHYQNAELLLNELIKYNKQFQFMAYPNRTHSISEGAGTNTHLSTLFTKYLKEHCPPGPASDGSEKKPF